METDAAGDPLVALLRSAASASMPSDQLTEHLTRTLRHILFD
ncbi:hypothetical protein [Nonomuraea cypriaca]|nr:hypothetical protein [Nonomuraea cypriaca]